MVTGAASDDLDAAFAIDGRPAPIIASIHTPYQLMFLERLLAQIEPRPLMIIDQRPEKYRAGRPVRHPGATVVDAAITGQALAPEQQSLMQETIARAEAFAAGQPFTFVCASFGWPFNNIAFTRWRRTGRTRFAMIEDGLSTYLQAGQSTKGRLRGVAIEAVSRLRGLAPRTLFGGHPLGLDLAEISAIFVGSTLVTHEGKRRYVPVPLLADTASTPRDPGLALMVGQPYMRDYGRAAIAAFAAKVRDHLYAEGVTRLQFKPHHFQSEEEIALYLESGFELIDPPVPIEEMIGESTHGVLASANTTALMTCKSMLGDAIRAIAFNPAAFSQVQESRRAEEVVSIFRRFGVEVVEF